MENTLVGDIPCKALKLDWDSDIQLDPLGNLYRCILAQDTVIEEIPFFAGERLEFGWRSGGLVRAVILHQRSIHGIELIPWIRNGEDVLAKGLNNGPQPNIYFNNKNLSLYFVRNLKIGKIEIPGTSMIELAENAQQISVSPVDSWFMGYPVMPSGALDAWNWERPKATVIIEKSLAHFVLGASVECVGWAGKEILPAGTKVSVDLLSGVCRTAVMPDGKTPAFFALKGLKPANTSAVERPRQAYVWASSYNGGDSGLKKAYTLIATRSSQEAVYAEIAREVLIFVDSSKGRILGNCGLDKNNDGILQQNEVLDEAMLQRVLTAQASRPISLSASDPDSFLTNKLVFEWLFADIKEFALEKLQSISNVVSQNLQPDPYKSNGSIDLLCSYLSSKGLHPLSGKNIYWFPDASGVKMLCDDTAFYPNGSPKYLVPDVRGIQDPSMKVLLPGTSSPIQVWLYKQYRVEEARRELQNLSSDFWKRFDSNYYREMNRFNFWENGSFGGWGALPYTQVALPAWTGAKSNLVHLHTARYNPYGDLYYIYPSDKEEFEVAPGITVVGPRAINWWQNVPWRKTFVQLYSNSPVKIDFKQGTYTFYKRKQGASDRPEDHESYAKTFDTNTSLFVSNYLIIDQEGRVSGYR